MTMTYCPKCHSGFISKPLYKEASEAMPEHLAYYCLTCGYSKSGPCKDAKKTPEPFAEYKLAIKEKANEP